MKLPLREAEEDALRLELDHWEARASSVLLRVEAMRACSRYGADRVASAARGLKSMTLVPIDDVVVEAAIRVRPEAIRSLDALHLATAQSLGDDLGVLITYDQRLADAARELGLPVASPA